MYYFPTYSLLFPIPLHLLVFFPFFILSLKWFGPFYLIFCSLPFLSQESQASVLSLIFLSLGSLTPFSSCQTLLPLCPSLFLLFPPHPKTGWSIAKEIQVLGTLWLQLYLQSLQHGPHWLPVQQWVMCALLLPVPHKGWPLGSHKRSEVEFIPLPNGPEYHRECLSGQAHGHGDR